MTVTFTTVQRGTQFWDRVTRGEREYVTRNQFYAGRKVHWCVLSAANLRWQSFEPPVIAMDAELGPAVSLG